MIKYSPANQLSIEDFKHPFDQDLRKDNRWVKLAAVVPWDKLAGIYARKLDSDAGRYSVDIRMVIGALIIKHKLQISDRETVHMISENMYMQYFCGLRSFQTDPPFDPSLFVDIRKRMGAAEFDAFNEILMEHAERLKPKRKRIRQNDKDKENGYPPPIKGEDLSKQKSKPEADTKQDPPNNGILKLDASVADQYITYPTDLKLLNRSREETERIIDILYKAGDFDKKPRTYRRKARKAYLAISKQRMKGKNQIRVALGKQLRFIARNLRTIDKMLDTFEGQPFPLCRRNQRIYWILQHIHSQQYYMYTEKTHICEDRIVNIYQPYVRPIVRGKERDDVEFGAKMNISQIDGFARPDHIGWDNYHEGLDLTDQVEGYKKLFDCYPELLLADQIYLTRANRKYMKERGIRIVGKPLGRPPKQSPLSAYQKRKLKKERNMRNHVEGKFGQGKNGYGLNQIRAKRRDTSESWISAIYFTMNLAWLLKLANDFLSYLKKRLYSFILALVKIIFDIIHTKRYESCNQVA